MTGSDTTLMVREAAEAGAVVRAQFARNAATVAALGERLRALRPPALTTLARGSSDNAATFGRYLVETRARVLTASGAPSVTSVYDAPPAMARTVAVAVSQSGRSPDLLVAAYAALAGGALLVAMVNDESSPLAHAADTVLPLCAGAERSVAATKSFVASLAAWLHLVGAWTQDPAVAETTAALPDLLDRAWDLDWSDALPVLGQAHSVYVVGRGPGYAVAQEAALKLKEVCGLHAEAFSAAEVRHGPMTLVERGFPVLLIGQDDESLGGVADLAREFAGRGAALLTAGLPADAPGIALPTLSADALLQPVLAVQSFYRVANALARLRGRDPDRPPHLAKVTSTR